MSRSATLGTLTGLALIAAAAVWVALRRPAEGGATKGPAQPARAASPCDRYRPANTRVRWACFPNGAPVDLVTEQSVLMTVLHMPTRVLVIDTEPLDPSIPVADPKHPPVRVCVLDKAAGLGLTGFVSPAALHETPCGG